MTHRSVNWVDWHEVLELNWRLEELVRVTVREEGLVWGEKGVTRRKNIVPFGSFRF